MSERPGERRNSLRRRPEECGVRSARVRPGHEVQVINLSAGGALIECSHRLLPGAAVILHLVGEHRQIEPARGRIIRAVVSRLQASAIRYRGAMAFDQQMSWLTDVSP
jgi:PilZ domain